jgi:hypothetical protein
LSARALIGRTQFATALVEGRGIGRETAFDPSALAERHGRGRGRIDSLAFCSALILGVALDANGLETLSSKERWNPESARHAVARLLAAPEAQTC